MLLAMSADNRSLAGWWLEQQLWQRGYSPLAGVDEAGRGALAGPVVAAAVVLPYAADYPFADSKSLSPARRSQLAADIKACALAWAVGQASAAEVDRYNVLQASKLASLRALAALPFAPAGLVTDFLKLAWPGAVLAVAKADAQSYQVAAASILAKVSRDALMVTLDRHYPHYGFARHKGYGSSQHLQALQHYGICPAHRHSFRPVATLQQGQLFPAKPLSEPHS